MTFTQLVPDPSEPVGPVAAERHEWHRARGLPATGIRQKGEGRRTAAIIAIILHVLLFLFILADPPLHTDPNLKELKLGAGGAGPAGGGGGGNDGTGGVKYIKIVEPPKPAVAPTVTPPKVVEPPKLPEPIIPKLEMPKLAMEPKVEVKIQSPVVGIGGGTGHDGTAGNGPGSGGGVGSGVGTGRGSGVGPGTGGGNGDVNQPMPKELFIPPFPIPSSVRCTHLIAQFDVDDRGKVLHMSFTPTKDGGYNRQLDDQFKALRWNPGTTLAGKPIPAKGQLTYDFPC